MIQLLCELGSGSANESKYRSRTRPLDAVTRQAADRWIRRECRTIRRRDPKPRSASLSPFLQLCESDSRVVLTYFCVDPDMMRDPHRTETEVRDLAQPFHESKVARDNKPTFSDPKRLGRVQTHNDRNITRARRIKAGCSINYDLDATVDRELAPAFGVNCCTKRRDDHNNCWWNRHSGNFMLDAGRIEAPSVERHIE